MHSVPSQSLRLHSGSASLRYGSLLAGFAVLSLSGCAASAPPVTHDDDTPGGDVVSTHEAIVHGALDRGKHPAVVALVSESSAGTALCTGALIGHDLVLTARHCVSEVVSEEVTCPGNGPQVGKNRAPNSIGIIIADNVHQGEAVAHGAHIFTPKGDALCDNDIALVLLDREIPDIEPLEVAKAGSPPSNDIIAVGYGLSANSGRAGIKHFRSRVSVLSSTANEFVVGESTCQGDSGGPAIDPASGEIVGVVSRGGQSCKGKTAQNIYTRVDPFAEWIARITKTKHGGPSPDDSATADAGAGHHHGHKTSPAATDLGDPCTDGTTCSTGVCVTATTPSYCSRDCGHGAGRCSHGFKCSRTKKGAVGVCTKK
ncbi:MAG: hypothetical protein NVSMB1_01100 [Polyangiales bacterium]